MASKETERMIKLGEWLESYLNPETQEKHLVKLLEDGAKLLGVPSKLSNKCMLSAGLQGRGPKIYRCDELMVTRELLTQTFKKLIEIKRPWIKGLPEIESSQHKLSGILALLRLHFSMITNTVQNISGEYVVSKSFGGDIVPNEKFSEAVTYTLDEHYMTIVAGIFFNFLLNGGQDRICFCKQCGRFTVIKRKGRKEYCSSLCRVRASNERIAQAGA